MYRHTPAGLLAVILALAAGAGVVLIADGHRQAAGTVKAREFQLLVGGLGLGPALDLQRCPFSFDPRLCPTCPEDDGLIPGGLFYCPYHAGSIFFYPQLRGRPLE
jgi:hypothetical protein